MMLTQDQADTIADIIDAGTQGNWPNTKYYLLEELGHSPEAIMDAVNALADITGRDPVIDASSLEDDG